MYFHAVSVVPYVPSRAAGGWRSGRTGRNGGDAARGGRRILSSFKSVFRWSEKDACCPVSVPGIARAEAFAGSRRKRGRIVPSPFASVFRPPDCAPADLFVSHEVVGGVLILHERTLRLEKVSRLEYHGLRFVQDSQVEHAGFGARGLVLYPAELALHRIVNRDEQLVAHLQHHVRVGVVVVVEHDVDAGVYLRYLVVDFEEVFHLFLAHPPCGCCRYVRSRDG